MKRFYKMVSVEQKNGEYQILLDGRAIKTKSGKALSCFNQNIANKVMREWAEQKETIIPDNMPFTQIENTRLDHVAIKRAEMTRNVLRYFDTDLICYLAENPEELVLEQNKIWSPWRAWFSKKFGYELLTTNGLSALSQDKKAHQSIEDYIANLDEIHFTILQMITSISGSVILGLAFMEKALKPSVLMEVIYIEENFKDKLYDAEKYGHDPLIERKKNATMLDINAAYQYLSYL